MLASGAERGRGQAPEAWAVAAQRLSHDTEVNHWASAAAAAAAAVHERIPEWEEPWGSPASDVTLEEEAREWGPHLDNRV